MKFRDLIEIQQLEEVDRLSQQGEKGVLIFKHSTRCAISSMAYSRFQRGWALSDDELPVYYLDLIRYREVSHAVAEKYGVQHESPQVLLIKDGRCVYHNSHQGIMPTEIAAQAEHA